MSEENKPTEEAKSAETSNTVALSAFYGVKAGMTRIFDEEGNHVPVTVIKLIPNYISKVKTVEKDGYESYQVAYGQKREKLVTKPVAGQTKKVGIKDNLTKFAEIKEESVSQDNLGKIVSLEGFAPSTYIDVSATSKGKGFQGVIKRWNFSCGPMSHGSKFHRTGGSIGMHTEPGRVFKNKKMPGHMGDKKVTTQNLKVVEVNEEKGYLLIKGSVPGAKNGFVRVSKATKK